MSAALRERPSLRLSFGLLGLCVAAGALVTYTSGSIAALAIGLPVGLAFVFARFGSTGASMILFITVVLFPVAANEAASPATIAGHSATTLRTAATIALMVLALFTVRSLRGPLRLTAALLALALCSALAGGVFAAFPDPNGTADSVLHSAGQPLTYALILVVFANALYVDPKAKLRLLRTWCFCLLAEAAVVAVQFGSGAALDTYRHITRAYGTMGSDFLGAFGVMSVFVALYLRSTATTTFDRRLGTASASIGIVMTLAAISRTSVIAFAVGIVVIAFGDLKQISSRNRLRVIVIFALLFGGTLFAMQGLWESRLSNPVTQGFDRPATWTAGLKLAEAYPVAGTGSTSAQFVEALQANSSLSTAGSIPHNAWIDELAGSGILCGLLFLWVTFEFAVAARPARGSPHGPYLLAAVTAGGITYGVNTMFTHPEITILMLLAVTVINADAAGALLVGHNTEEPALVSPPRSEMATLSSGE